MEHWKVVASLPEQGQTIIYEGDNEAVAKDHFEEEKEAYHPVQLFLNGNRVEEYRLPGRPIERAGIYRRITLEIREDLLRKVDASGTSRREFIEALLVREFDSPIFA